MANPPHVAKGKQAVKLLHCAKAPRCNGIPPEVFKNRPLALKRRVLRLSLNIWESEILPKNWRPSSCHSSSGRTPSQTAVLTENLSPIHYQQGAFQSAPDETDVHPYGKQNRKLTFGLRQELPASPSLGIKSRNNVENTRKLYCYESGNHSQSHIQLTQSLVISLSICW